MKPLKLALSPTRNRRLNELLGFLLLVAASLLLLSLISFHPSDPSFNTVSDPGRAVSNWIGRAGALTSDLLLQMEGLAAFCVPLLLGSIAMAWMRSRPTGSSLSKLLGALLCLLFLPAIFGLLPGHLHLLRGLPVEGLIGLLVSGLLVRYLNLPGAWIVSISMVAVALYLSTAFSLNTAQEWLAVRFAFIQSWRDRFTRWKQLRARAREQKQAARLEAARAKTQAKAVAAPAQPRAPKQVKPVPEPVQQVPERRKDALAAMREEEELAAMHEQEQAPETVHEAPPQRSVWEQMPRASVPDPEPLPEPPSSIAVGERADAEIRTVTLTPKTVSGYRLPPSTLLHRSEESQTIREDELREEAKVLVEKCAEFDVGGQVVQINPGPVVTTFEFRPEAGVKYSRVTGLSEDLCLAMRAESILIERMAGKSTVGIQVPNHTRETIWLRDIVEAENFSSPKSKLTLAMGKDINGRIVTADLATMPHVLIAGSTGSGKSVAINAMIMSVLFKATPEQVRLILVDPKRVELGMYEGIPHLFTPIITEPKLAANALRNAVREMERRLKLLASRSVRNIDQYNKLFENPSLFEDGEDENPLPYIIIIIDELADLMMLDKANVEEAITRLAQMARAVGIHLVLATQRPSVDVITGLIKANVPTRISFRLATKVDSRTILDSNGAESLLGRGDMLFLPPGTSRLQRVHAPFVTEKEIAAVTEFWKKQGEAEYVQGFLEGPKDDRGRDLEEGNGEDSNDELYEDGVRLVLEFGKASTSLLQRRLRIGYGRAAHLIDMMERDGIVGPADGSKPREILKPPDWLNEVEQVIR